MVILLKQLGLSKWKGPGGQGWRGWSMCLLTGSFSKLDSHRDWEVEAGSFLITFQGDGSPVLEKDIPK